MEKSVVISIKGIQKYEDAPTDTIELVTEGTLTGDGEGYTLTYQESPAAIKIAEAYDIQTTATLGEVLLGLVPSACVSLCVVLGSLLGCAWLLDRKVSF